MHHSHSTLFQDNPSEKDINQGTLVVFNLDPSVSNDDLRQIFGAYGEVKEVLPFGCVTFIRLICFFYPCTHPCINTLCAIMFSSLIFKFPSE
jgi:RNA recognition motif-containing protein